jgi:hypothetical protein
MNYLSVNHLNAPFLRKDRGAASVLAALSFLVKYARHRTRASDAGR